MRAPCTVQGPIPGIAVSCAMSSSSGSLLKTSGSSRPSDSRPARSRSVLIFRHESLASRARLAGGGARVGTGRRQRGDRGRAAGADRTVQRRHAVAVRPVNRCSGGDQQLDDAPLGQRVSGRVSPIGEYDDCMKRITVSLPDELAEKVRRAAGGERRVSSYVAAALEDYAERENLDEVLAAWHAETPVPDEVRQQVQGELDHAGLTGRSGQDDRLAG